MMIHSHDDATRTVTTYDETGAVTGTRPYTEDENAAADAEVAEAATLTDLADRVARIEAKLWPADPDPDPDAPIDAPTWGDYGGIWPNGQLLSDGGTVWRNVSGVPLASPPTGFPGQPSEWTHLFVEVVAQDPEPTASPWDPDATYTIGDRCTRDGRLYGCLIEHGPERQGTWGPPATGVWEDLGPAN